MLLIKKYNNKYETLKNIINYKKLLYCGGKNKKIE
jgi:hypothetical protein